MTECRSCQGQAPNAYLCPRCITDLRQALTELPWWLERLTEAALGQTRMSDNGGRRSAPRRVLDGETPIAACIEPFPNPRETDLERARRARAKAALRHALATGGINARASELLAEIADSLACWCRVLCESRGVAYRPAPSRSALGVNHALWLAHHADTIAAADDAGDIAADILGWDARRPGLIEQVQRVVNRPIAVRFLGKCPNWIQDRPGRPDGPCGADLRAPEDAIEVYCRRCRHTHNANRLLLATMDDCERTRVTWEMICRINRMQPAEWRVADRTLRYWRDSGVLKARGWRRPDGRSGLAQHGDDDQPLFLWSDVRKLRMAKPQKVATGATAHRRSE